MGDRLDPQFEFDNFIPSIVTLTMEHIVDVKVQEKDIKDDIISVLKRNTHSLKGSLRSMNRLDVSEMVHQFEGSFNNLEDLRNSDLEEFSKDFIGNYVEIKDIVRSIYQQSDMNMPYTKQCDDWSEIFKNFYDFCLY